MGRRKKKKYDRSFYDLVQKKFVHIKCTKCKKKYEIRVNDPKIYTKEVLDNWKCPLCKNRKK